MTSETAQQQKNIENYYFSTPKALLFDSQFNMWFVYGFLPERASSFFCISNASLSHSLEDPEAHEFSHYRLPRRRTESFACNAWIALFWLDCNDGRGVFVDMERHQLS